MALHLATYTLLLLLAISTHCSNAYALYCVCKYGVPDSSLQKAVEQACRHGADCSPIMKHGACYNPNTVKNHCDYAVNSYFQRRNQAAGSCDFSGVAALATSIPEGQSSKCVYPSAPGGKTLGASVESLDSNAVVTLQQP